MIQREVLPNGIKVATERVPGVRSVSIEVTVTTGSRNESAKNSGISHFIEHMMFKGTQKRDAYEISKTLESVGGSLNAGTGRENTSYYAKVVDKDLPLAIDLLSDILLNSLFSEQAIVQEKGVVVQEIKRDQDFPVALVRDLFARTIWPGHPLSQPILGRRSVIKDLRRQDILDHLAQEYTPDRMVITAAGKLRHKEVVEMIEAAFGGLSGGPSARKMSPPVARSRVAIKRKSLEQVHLLLGAKGCSFADERRFAITILNIILGGGSSSRLFQEIREKRGLAYSIHSGAEMYRDAGLVSVYAGVDPTKFAQVVDLVLAELSKLKARPVSDGELQRAKELLKAPLILGLEDTSSRAARLANSEVCFGRIVPVEELLAKIDGVTAQEVLGAAEQIFTSDGLTLVSIGPMSPDEYSKERLRILDP